MNSISFVKEVKVGINFGDGVAPVGRLAMRERTIYFEYDRTFIERGLELSPLRLPLSQVFSVLITICLRVYQAYLMTAYLMAGGACYLIVLLAHKVLFHRKSRL